MRRRHFAPLVAIALAACGGSGGGGGDGGSGGTGGSAEACEQAPSQGLSQPCCLAHGVDACGAALFCATFDGRKTATCYAERSRLDGTTCGEDRHCLSGSCNVDAGLCRTLGRKSSCDPGIGCAPEPATGRALVCVASTSACELVGDGTAGSICATVSDCLWGACISNSCVLDGAVCGGDVSTGPCAADPTSELCFGCRARSIECWSECWDESMRPLNKCLEEANCLTPTGTGNTIDLACAMSHCDEEFCLQEQCASRRCNEVKCH